MLIESAVLFGTAALALLYRTSRRSLKVDAPSSCVPFVEVMSADISTSIVRVGDRHLTLQLTLPPDTIEPLFSGGAWAGTVVWPASIHLANYLHRKGCCAGSMTVLELGAGVGVPGIVASMLGARRVILTEQPPLVELLERNSNQLFPEKIKTKEIAVTTIDWRHPNAAALEYAVDLILISDCIYEGLYGEVWKDLANVLSALLIKGGKNRALNSVERRREDGIDRFIAFARAEYQIESTLVAKYEMDDRTIELYEMKRS